MFGKHSTRTRTSLEVGIYQMGGLGTYLSAADMQIARGEPIQDTARVLGRYYDAIVYRTFKQSDVDALAKYSGVPVVSGMTDYAHPLQVLTDLMTVREYKGKLAGLKAGFVGDGYNMANSLIVGCLMMGMDFTIACPNGYRPSADVLFFAREYGDHFKLTTDPDEAARDADVLFTDVWTSMGMERETERRRRDFNGFCLDAARMALAKPDCMVQHPLPAHRGEEITPDIFEAHADEIFDEAENRLHVEKAVLGILLAGNNAYPFLHRPPLWGWRCFWQKRAPPPPIPRHGARLLFLLVGYHLDVVFVFRHSAPRGKLFRCGGGKGRAGFCKPQLHVFRLTIAVVGQQLQRCTGAVCMDKIKRSAHILLAVIHAQNGRNAHHQRHAQRRRALQILQDQAVIHPGKPLMFLGVDLFQVHKDQVQLF